MRTRLNRAELRYRVWHPPIYGNLVTKRDVAEAIVAQDYPSPTELSVSLQRRKNVQGAPRKDWRTAWKNLKKPDTEA